MFIILSVIRTQNAAKSIIDHISIHLFRSAQYDVVNQGRRSEPLSYPYSNSDEEINLGTSIPGNN